MGNAIFPEEATIYITTIDVLPSALASTDAVTAEVTNFSESGGEEDVESIPVFGGGNIDKVNPRTQIEVSFDVINRYDTEVNTLLKWDSYKWGTIVGSAVSSAGDSATKRVYVQWSDGTTFYTRAYDNARAVTYEPESSADDYLKGTVTFKLSPTDADGNAQLQVAGLAATAIPAWS